MLYLHGALPKKLLVGLSGAVGRGERKKGVNLTQMLEVRCHHS